jgi:hypothetical protein
LAVTRALGAFNRASVGFDLAQVMARKDRLIKELLMTGAHNWLQANSNSSRNGERFQDEHTAA